MDRLILMRHGKALSESESGDDFDRQLAPRGVEEAGAMARRLAALGVRPDLAIVSAAVRTRETWAACEPAFPGTPVRFDRALYNATAALIRYTAEISGAGTVLMVGHNPGLQDLTVRLMVGGAAGPEAVARAQRHFPPASAAVFLIGPIGRASYDGLFFPKDPA